MARRKRTFGSYRSPPVPRQMLSAKETVEGVKGHERYMREYGTHGIIRMEVFQELVQPYISGIKTNPNLTSEQKSIAVKEFFRRFREGLADFMMTIRGECERYATAFVIPVATSPAKPSAGGYEGWYV
ncbi:MAG: hypothetical protein ACPLY9_04910 [Nitrososphaerales archaeon]